MIDPKERAKAFLAEMRAKRSKKEILPILGLETSPLAASGAKQEAPAPSLK